jgi:hypothetical protein
MAGPKIQEFYCEGPICQNFFLPESDGELHSCIAKYMGKGWWKLPERWKVIDNHLHCPRCFKYIEKQSK